MNRGAAAAVSGSMDYVPPDPTKIEASDEAIRFWSSTLEVKEDKLRSAV